MNETKIINRLSTVGIAGNIALVVFKLYAGIAGHSGAMVSDAVHSLSDVFATLVAYIGVRISKKAPDQDHPYGHDRLECVASMILGMILLATGFGIGLNGVKQIAAGHYEQLAVPSAIALAAAVVSIVSKEVMFWYTRYYAKKLNSSAFMADAWHHRSDALSSVGSLIGIGGAMLGVPVMEPVACVAICLCILKVAYDILKDSIDKMLDTACSPEYEASLRSFIAEQDGVRLYPDLIKAQVSLESGLVIGVEANNYLRNHVSRDLPAEILGEQAALRGVRSMQAQSVRLALIPKNTAEVLCYEVRGKKGEGDYLVYLNAVTGRTEEILKIVVEDEGEEVV